MSAWHRIAACALLACPWPASAQPAQVLDEVVVTATARPEPRSRIAGTVQVIGREKIEHSNAKSVADLLAENAVGFLSEWTPGQTSINIRGAASDGQGRDFRSQVLVLLNGHRAGTANISKLSLADVDRIEIVRGPASVIYGSQNLGGVINIILKTGRSAPGTLVEVATGSWGLGQGKAQTGGTQGPFDWYAGVSGGRRDNFHIGGGAEEINTAWKRAGATGALGVQLDPDHRLDVNVRTDGVYDAGFRGSSANVFAVDDRFNRSFDASYNGRLADDRASWFFQTYAVTDVDDLNNPSPLGAATAATRTRVDHNRRQLDIVGTRFQPRVRPWDGNELLLGWDWERSWLRSDRLQLGLGGAPLAAQASPFDNNQTENVHAFYAEDAQTLFDRLTLRAGLRRTFGTTAFDPTPNLATQAVGSQAYQATTYSAGATLRAFDWLSLRVGASSGFRAPTATDLAVGPIVTFTGNTIFGNPGLRPETSRQVEAGATVIGDAWRLDAAVFQNIIGDRIVTRARAVANTSDTINNPGDIVVRGVELQAEADLVRTFRIAAADGWRWSAFGNGYYHFDMLDRGAPATANTDKPQRIYQYQGAVGTRFGQAGGGPLRDWSLQLTGVLRGPMWYDTEENLLIPLGEPLAGYIHRKSPFWTWNARTELLVAAGWTAFAGVNNIFDLNRHPIFIALDERPCIANPVRQNGACGNSMPGREFVVGLQGRW